MLFLIGLGLGDEKDITLKGLEAIRSSDYVFLEGYTSILPSLSDSSAATVTGTASKKVVEPSSGLKRLEEFYGKKITIADREMIESGADFILDKCGTAKSGAPATAAASKEGEKKTGNVSVLVVGDPFGATTHTDLFLRARERGIEVRVIHNASIINAVGCCGLQLYNFGQVVSIPLFQGNWKPESFYDKLEVNLKNGLHTLCLLDIKVKEPNLEILEKKGKVVYDPPYYMTVGQALEQLIYVESVRKKGILIENKTICVGLARIGDPDQTIIAGTLGEVKTRDFGPPLHSLIIVGGRIHELEFEMLKLYGLKQEYAGFVM